MENQESAADILAERDALQGEVMDLREDVLCLNEDLHDLRKDRDAWRDVSLSLLPSAPKPKPKPVSLTSSEGGLLLAALSLIRSLAGEAERSGRGSNHSSPASPAGEA